MKIRGVLTFWKSRWTERGDYRGATKTFIFDELRKFGKQQFFVKLKINTVSTFGKYRWMERVNYRGATKNFVKLIFSNKCDRHADRQTDIQTYKLDYRRALLLKI